jgi:hypothetical protein
MVSSGLLRRENLKSYLVPNSSWSFQTPCTPEVQLAEEIFLKQVEIVEFVVEMI